MCCLIELYIHEEKEVPYAGAAEPGAGEHCPYSTSKMGLAALALKVRPQVARISRRSRFTCINTGTDPWKLLPWTASSVPAVKQGNRVSRGWWGDTSPTCKSSFVTEKVLLAQMWRDKGLIPTHTSCLTRTNAQWVSSPLLDVFSVLKFHVVMNSQEIQMCCYSESILKGQMFWYVLRSGHSCLFGIVSFFNVNELDFHNIIG